MPSTEPPRTFLVFPCVTASLRKLTVVPALLLLAVLAAAPLPAAPPSPSVGGKDGAFTIARLKYGGGGDWYVDESSPGNLLRELRRRGDIRVRDEKVQVVTPNDEELWNYPMLFMTGHGNVKFSDEEVRSLRRYLDAGGFLWADDCYGMDKSFREQVKRLYPESPLVELPFSHPLFRSPNPFPNGSPKIHEHDGGPARVFAIIAKGRMTVLYTFDTDIGDGIEDEGVHDDPPEKRDAAMRFAVNIATYVVTH